MEFISDMYACTKWSVHDFVIAILLCMYTFIIGSMCVPCWKLPVSPCSKCYLCQNMKSVLCDTDSDGQPEKKRRRRIKNDLFDSSSDDGKHLETILKSVCPFIGDGDGVAQLVECWTQDSITWGSNPVRGARKKLWEFFLSQKCCGDSLSVCPTPLWIRTHKNGYVCTLKIL